MKLEYIMNNLAYIDLIDLATVKDSSGKIKEERHPHVISAINGIVAELYTTYNIKRSISEITTTVGQHIYEIDSSSLVQILKAKEAEYIREDQNIYNKNKRDNPTNIDIISNTQIFIKDSSIERKIWVEYQDSLEPLDNNMRNTKLLEQTLDIPFWLERPIRLGVAAEIYSSMSGEAQTIKGRDLTGRYRGAILLLAQEGKLQTFNHTYVNIPRINGFV